MANDSVAHRLAVVGAGVMGSSITALALGHGVPVLLVDIDEPTLDRARTLVRQQLRHAQLMGAIPAGAAEGDLTTSVSLTDIHDRTSVVEAVTESPDIKADVLRAVSGAVAPGTPIISNTSGIPIDELADWVSRPADLLGTHFMNPPYLIKTVEVVRGPRTGEQAMTAAAALLATLDRQPIEVRDAPGFVTSRLLHPMINAAARIVGEGTATAESVDALMRGCLGHPTGPLRTADLIGIDNLVDSLAVLHKRIGDESCRPCEPLLAKVRAGDLGRKTGRGFYDYGKALS